ncbi:aldehyde dehydrogenase family protein [Microbacterium album]|uniref:Aldehyde dehydrogenase n=1 Tax=Microbacterium album TaxID=2053191 RepID=A0A917MMQ4_9MICO|nr:aldehyde dehydrogenase family protein [Microbacterium album]GGH45781.1 aldehyde dehydrogenase [Microbacterium album]
MHDDTAAREWYDRLHETLGAHGVTVPEDTPRARRVTVPWRREWGFWHLDATPEQADAAVAAAREAGKAWRADEGARREALRALADAVAANSEVFTRLISFENGKLAPAAAMEVGASVGSLRLFADAEIPVEVLRRTETETLRLVREPIGVVVAITPANMPLLMLVNKVATALLTGNTVVAKPSPYTPLSALLLGALAAPVLPPGVFQVVPGDAEIGRALVEHPDTGMITLTGSRAAGKAVMAAAAGTLKRVQLELGGNDPAIVLPDAPLDEVLPEIFRSAFASSGQACVATKRVYVPAERAEEVTAALVRLADAARVGTPFDAEATHPALTNIDQYRRVAALIETVGADGGQVRTGGVVDTDEGFFIRPTVVSGLGDGAELVDEEQFGPVLPVIRYDDVDAVIDTVNSGPYGLGATIWTADEAAAEPLARRLDVGMAWINRTPRPDPTIPFGGMKESGIGREGGSAGLDAFCELKVIGASGGAA